MIPLHSLLVYCGVYAVAIAVPGPAIIAIIARAMSGGFRSTISVVMGNITGDLVLMTLSALGLAVIARQMGSLFLVVRLAGAAYLIYLGYKLWTAKVPDKAPMATSARQGFVSQLMVTLGNPKALVMFVALMPTVVDLKALTIAGYAQLCLCTLVLIPGIEFAYAGLASRAGRFLMSVVARKRMNKSAGAIMIGAGIGVAVN